MPEKSITVRLAEPGDLAYVSQDGYLSAEINLRKIKLGEVFLLLADAEPAGYLKLEYLWSSIPHISLIRVEPHHRGQGYSRALLGFIEEHLRNQGHTALYSSSQVDEPAPHAWHRHPWGLQDAVSSMGSMQETWAKCFSGNSFDFSQVILTFYYKAAMELPFQDKFGKIKSDLKIGTLHTYC